MLSKRRISILGAISCALYLFAAIALVATALSASDPKGRFVLLQLPIALQMWPVDAMGLGNLLSELSWPAAYIIFGIPTLVILYLIGAVVEHFLRRIIG